MTKTDEESPDSAEYMEQALEEMRRFRDEDWRG